MEKKKKKTLATIYDHLIKNLVFLNILFKKKKQKTIHDNTTYHYMNFKYQFIYFTMISYFKTNPKQKYFKCYKCYNIIHKFHTHKIKTRATH